MPPRIAPGRGQGPRGGGRGRGAGAGRGGLRVDDHPSIADHVTAIGIKRPGYGTAGRRIMAVVNIFETTVPDSIIYHYDAIQPGNLPPRFNQELMKELQSVIAPDIFTPPAIYDGRANMYAARKLPLGASDSREFKISVNRSKGKRAPKIYTIIINKVATINPEILKRFVAGQQSPDNAAIQTTLMAMNVAIRMEPNQKYPFNSRSFFTEDGKQAIGGGLELRRGYFQSVLPSIGRVVINLDISTGLMYKAGPLIGLCLEVLGQANPAALSPRRGFPDRERVRLERFISKIRISTTHTGSQQIRVLRKLSPLAASHEKFTTKEGKSMTVADYFKQLNIKLQHPDIICAELTSGALLPLELCTVVAGQFVKKQVPPNKTKDVVRFATMRPEDRFKSIQEGLQVLSYGQSEYIRQFGMNISPTPTVVEVRVLEPPTVKYGAGSKQITIKPANGKWNMLDKRFFKPARITRWIVVVYENPQRFNEATAKQMAGVFIRVAVRLGITVDDPDPLLFWQNGQGDIGEQLKRAGRLCVEKHGSPPNLIVVILPDTSGEIYTAVKHFGDITMGVATQCLLSKNCSRANDQYWSNVMLKVNVKLDGINSVPDLPTFIDPANPTIIMGADVIHPAPGTQGRPSFTALVSSVDLTLSKYVSISRVQVGKREIINDLEEMCKGALGQFASYQRHVEHRMLPPARLIFFRDGVSEGEFSAVLKRELPMIKNACRERGVNPKITLVIVGKRHNIRMRPEDIRNGDRSGNLPAGSTIDKGIGHPVEFDYWQYTHGGILGTSRPGHYTVLYDENKMTPDSMQALSFALAHTFARSTSSVSIPAPVYYADIVCSRAKTHYKPGAGIDFSESASETSLGANIEAFKDAYLPLHQRQAGLMYFM